LELAVGQLPDPSLAIQPPSSTSRDGTLAPAASQVAPATTPAIQGSSPPGERSSATPPDEDGGATVSTFESAQGSHPRAPIGQLARARDATVVTGKPGSAALLVAGGAAVVVAVIGFVLLSGKDDERPPAPSSAPAA